VETNPESKVTVLWNPQGKTVSTVAKNKPDIIIRGNQKETSVLLDTAISGVRNVMEKDAEVLSYTKSLPQKYDVCVMLTTKVMTVIMWATGTTSKLFRKYLSNILGKHEIKELQKKTAILGTVHVLLKVRN